MNERISAYLAERIAANDFPSAVYLVAEKGEIVFHDALGNSVVNPEIIPAKLDTIYDLASLTKPLVTGLLAALQVESGELDLGTTHGTSPFFADSPVAALTLRELVSHTSGLPAWIPLYLSPGWRSPSAIATAIGEQTLKPSPQVEYSDLNFISLAFLIGGDRLESVFADSVIGELALKRTGFNPLLRGIARDEIAASEMGNGYERQTCIDRGYDTEPPEGGTQNAFRNGLIWGEVHDGNAYFMGGVAGHAGLFSTAEEVFKIAMQFLPGHTKLLRPETCELFRTNFTPGMNEDRSFAFQLASTKDSTAGTRMSPQSFGHNGFTGTSLWIDPVKDRIFVLLTNRTHAHPLPFVNINSVRRRFHDLAIEELEKN